MAQIYIENVQKEILGEKLFAIKQLNVTKNKKIGIIGNNGTGKTTFLEMLAGKDQIYQGKIKIEGSCYLVPQLKENTNQSGGEQVRTYLDQAFRVHPEILLLDEPTANLDLENQNWLIKKLLRYSGIVIFVTHDRHLLEKLATTIWEVGNQIYTEYQVDYPTYLKQKEQEISKQTEAFKQYKQNQKKLALEIQRKKEKADQLKKAPKGISHSDAKAKSLGGGFDGKQRKLAKAAKSLEHRMDKAIPVEKVKKAKPIKLINPEVADFNGKTIMRITDLDVTFSDQSLLKQVSFIVNDGERIAISGPNQSGKTTLLKTLLEKKHPAIYLSPEAKIGYFSQNLQTIRLNKTVLVNAQYFSSQPNQIVLDVLGAMGFRKEKVKQVASNLSGGEQVRLSLVQILLSDSNVLVLDEPTNFLDLQAMQALEQFLINYSGAVLFVSHDEAFIDHVATRKFVIRNKQLFREAESKQLSSEKHELISKLQLLQMKKETWIADPNIPIAQIKQINQTIDELNQAISYL